MTKILRIAKGAALAVWALYDTIVWAHRILWRFRRTNREMKRFIAANRHQYC